MIINRFLSQKNIIQIMSNPNTQPQFLLSWQDQPEEHLYESTHVDELLQTSYVELENIAQRFLNGEENANFNSGESFYQKPNNLFLSEMEDKKYKRVNNKKLQCDIGSGMPHIETPTVILQSKLRRLQILKMIKLVRLIFKHMRMFKEKLVLEMTKEEKKNKRMMDQIGASVREMHGKYVDAMGSKDLRIMELEEEVSRLTGMNQWLAHKLESNERASQQLIQEFQEEKIKSLAEINDASLTVSLKAEEIQEQNESLEQQISFYQTQVSNLQEISHNHEVQIKKLEYLNEELERENNDLILKQQQIIKEYHQHEQIWNETSLQLSHVNQELSKMAKVNNLYQIELENTKKEVKRLRAINEEMIKESEEIILSELNRYQEDFNAEIQKINKKHREQIDKQNDIIAHLRQMSDKPRPKAKNVIFQQIDTNSSQNSIIYQSQQTIRLPIAASQCKIPLQKCSENNLSHANITQRQESNHLLQSKKSFKKAIESERLVKSKKTLKSIQDSQSTKKPLIPGKQASDQFVFKATSTNPKLKLSQYLQIKQEKIMSASDGMHQASSQLHTMHSKLSRLNLNLDSHFLNPHRK